MKKLSLNPAWLPYSWRYRARPHEQDQGAQIDLLFDRNDHSITICEIKYSDQPFVIDKEYAKKLQSKIDIFCKKTKTSKQIFLAIISANGLKKSLYSEELVKSIVTMDDLFQ